MRKYLVSAASAAVLALSAAAPAHAGFIVVALTDQGVGGGSKVCSTFDAVSQAACITAGFSFGAGPNFNEVSYNGTIFGYSVSITSTQTNLPGTAAFAEFNMSYTNVLNNTSTGSFVFNATGYGFTMPAGPALTMFGSQTTSGSNSALSGDVTSRFYVDGNGGAVNPVFAGNPEQSMCMLSTGVGATGTYSKQCDAPGVNFVRTPGGFSVADVVRFDLDQGQRGVNGSSNMTIQNTIPEPMTTALVGLALFGLAFTSRRRSAKM